LTAHWPNGDRLDVDDPIARAAQELRDGMIVALKGIGGFHLACDATSEDAVVRLRARKRRDEKPFAVMVANLAQAEAIAVLGEAERSLLTSCERPIVLARARELATLAGGVAPHNRNVGLMLPYSPLHHLLLADAGRPLVMTSGNLSDEPIAFDNADAIRRLGGIADLFLLHDRDIVTRTDDSVATIVAGSSDPRWAVQCWRAVRS
jgi:hydrogenase maturation protein HypF